MTVVLSMRVPVYQIVSYQVAQRSQILATHSCRVGNVGDWTPKPRIPELVQPQSRRYHKDGSAVLFCSGTTVGKPYTR